MQVDDGSQVRVHVHANDVSLSIREPVGSSIQNVFLGVIESIHEDFHPASCLIGVRHECHTLLARITQKAVTGLQLEVGTKVWAQIKSVALAEH